MIITPKDFRDNVFSALNTFWADRTPIAWPNLQFDPAAVSAYLEARLVGNPGGNVGSIERTVGAQRDYGSSTFEQTRSRSGLIVLTIYVRQGPIDTTGQLYDLVDAALSFLNHPRLIPETIIGKVGATETGPDGTFFVATVTGEYTYFTDEATVTL